MKQKVFLGVSMKVARPYSEIECHFFDELRFHSSVTTKLLFTMYHILHKFTPSKNYSGNIFILFYLDPKYYVEDVVCESQAH